MNNYFLLFLIATSIHCQVAFAQLTIESCQQKARNNYPQLKQYGLLEQSEAFSISNANKGYLPQVSFIAQATYQSDITSLPQDLAQVISKISGETIDFKSINKDQYRVVAEVNQVLWDGGNISAQKEVIKASTLMEKQKLEVELYTLKERINHLFFGILVLNEQIKQLELLENELHINHEKFRTYQKNGMANKSDVDIIRVEQLKALQKKAELTAVRQSYQTMLAAMTGDMTAATEPLVKPDYRMIKSGETTIERPELHYMEARTNFIASRENSIRAANLPRMGVYAQGGYGNPGLNMLEPGFTPWYSLGARLTWNFSGLYTQKNKLKETAIDKKNIAIQKETFLFNTQLNITHSNHEIERIKEQLKSDDEIIALRISIKKAAEMKVENGTMSITDLLREVTAENSAIQEKALREIQLLMAIYKLNTITNH